MTTTLSEFYSLVRDEINRGDSYDSLIPNKVAQAVKWVERTHTFKHMERYVEFTIDPDAAYPRTIAVPVGFKSMNFWRLSISDADLRYLTMVNPKDVQKRETDEYPTGFWMDGLEYFWLDNTPQEEIQCEMGYNKWTILPAATDTGVPVLDSLQDVILAQTMMLFVPTLRLDEKTAVMYKGQREEAMQSAVLADTELRNMNTDEAMIYQGQRGRRG